MITLFTDPDATQEEIDGRSYSLIKMTSGGFSVPPGMLITVKYLNKNNANGQR